MSEALDRRLHAYRTDIADARLRGRIQADRFTEGTPGQVVVPSTAVHRAPQDNASVDTELLFGEIVTVFDENDGWVWVQNTVDRYVGYVRTTAIDNRPRRATDRVKVLGTFAYSEPDIKSPPLFRLSMGARLAVTDIHERFSQIQNGGWVITAHISNLQATASDHVAVAQQFLHTPYLWGGRTSLGLDCSGLVQIALDQCGKSVLRDTDMQAETIGEAIPFDGNESILQRGDLVFWPGHVGIWIDQATFLHANATDMAVSCAPLQDIAARIESVSDDRISVVRRP